MKIGLAYDLKDDVPAGLLSAEDALEEYDSPETVHAITATLEGLGHSVVALGGGRDFLNNVLRENLNLVFNIAEGRGTFRSREAQVPAVLEMLDIPYSGSDPECMAVCLDKPLTKTLLKAAGIDTPAWQVIHCHQELQSFVPKEVTLPAFVKPAYEGSSKGIRLASRVESQEDIFRVAGHILKEYRQPALVESFIAGHEVTVGVIDSPARVLGIMRVVPNNGTGSDFAYTVEAKRDWQNMVSYECPATLPETTLRKIEQASVRAFHVLGCRDVARVDYRVSTDGKPYLLEVNPLPGLRPGHSDLPIMASAMGHDYVTLIELILSNALRRYAYA